MNMRLLFLIVGVLAILIEDIPCYAKSDSRLEVAVTVNSNYRGESPENLPFIQKAAEEAGVSVEWQVYDQKNWQEQFQLKIEEEKQPDIFINCITETDFAEYKDKFMELDQLIENEAPDIMKAYQEDPLLRVYSTQEDGHIYGLAVKRPYRPYIWKKWIINKNWLKVIV